MRTSQNGINLITSFEGCYTKAYWDKYGKKWTIGYGHTGADVYEGKVISKAEADELLKQDLIRFEKYVNNKQYVPLQLNQNQFDALVSFTYNTGQGNLKKLVAGRNLQQIADELLEYKRSNGQVLKGLLRRRTEERKLFLSGTISIPQPTKKYELKINDSISNIPIGDFTLHMDTILERTPENSFFFLGDYNNNGYLDLYYIKTACPVFVEVHVLNGQKNYKEFLLQVQTPLKEENADFDYCLGDYNHDGFLDLFCIKKNNIGKKMTEVHILSGKSNFKEFILHKDTCLHETNNNSKFCVGDYNGDGNLDLFYISKKNNKSKKTEVHILKGCDEYQSFHLNCATCLDETNDDWDFGVSNYISGRNKDIYCIKKRIENGNNKCTEVHILNGSTNYTKFAFQTQTKLHETDETFDFYPICKQLFIISKQGASNFTEIHALKV